jgi:hypothetical protein
MPVIVDMARSLPALHPTVRLAEIDGLTRTH